jgi:small subunit ribosomal protein S20
MANHKSAEKRARQIQRRNAINRRNRSRLRTAIKKLRAALAARDHETAQALLPKTISIIDKSIHKGVLHPNAAARYKSRLTSQVNALTG